MVPGYRVRMKALILTNEYPPHFYGGAGVHVDYLTRELAKLMEVEVRCFGDQDRAGPPLRVKGFGLDHPTHALTRAGRPPLVAALEAALADAGVRP